MFTGITNTCINVLSPFQSFLFRNAYCNKIDFEDKIFVSLLNLRIPRHLTVLEARAKKLKEDKPQAVNEVLPGGHFHPPTSHGQTVGGPVRQWLIDPENLGLTLDLDANRLPSFVSFGRREKVFICSASARGWGKSLVCLQLHFKQVAPKCRQLQLFVLLDRSVFIFI